MKKQEGIKFLTEGSPNTKLKRLHQEKGKMSPFYILIIFREKAKSGTNYFVVFNLFIFPLRERFTLCSKFSGTSGQFLTEVKWMFSEKINPVNVFFGRSIRQSCS